MNLYMDNSATSYPKPDSVYDAIYTFMKYNGTNPGRGAYKSSLKCSSLINSCREELCRFFNFKNSQNVIFTKNITESLNILIKGVCKNGWHVLTSSMDHNSVLRPLESLKNSGIISYDVIPCKDDGTLDVDNLKNYVKENTKLLVISHSSNIVGTVQDIEAISDFCSRNNIFFILDSAQSAGIIPIDFEKLKLSALAFTGHKGLFGPQGTGGFIISNELNEILNPFIEGGTGSMSYSICQPDFLPDKYESGTLNAPGIAGLYEGLIFINKEGIHSIREKEDYLSKLFIEKLLNMKNMSLYGRTNVHLRTSAISINSTKMNNAELSFALSEDYGIMTRSGLHCAPFAHKTIGTFPDGTTRFSFGYFNEKEDIDYAVNAINNINNSI